MKWALGIAALLLVIGVALMLPPEEGLIKMRRATGMIMAEVAGVIVLVVGILRVLAWRRARQAGER